MRNPKRNGVHDSRTNNCGCDDPAHCAPRLDRRTFLEATALSLLAATARGKQHQHPVPVEKGLPAEWIADSLQIKETDYYKNERLRNVAFPLGGIGTGFFAVSGFGEWIEWQIFNNINKKARVPMSGLFISTLEDKNPPNTRALQKPSKENAGFSNIQFKGAYPVGEWQFSDDAFPIEATMRAWNPFVPLDAGASEAPAALFTISATNKSDKSLNIAIYGTLFNAAGYGGQAAIDVNDPKFTNNLGITSQERVGAIAHLGPKSYQPSKINNRLRILAIGNAPAWDGGSPPAGLECIISPSLDGIVLNDFRYIFAGAGAAAPSRERWRELENWVRSGGTFILTKEPGSWLDAAKAGAAPGAKASDTIIFESFNSDLYRSWKTTGEAFGRGPVSGPVNWQNPVSGWTGGRFVNSFQPDDAPHGTLTSPEFTIERDFIHLLVGGGAATAQTFVELKIGNKTVYSASGQNVEKLIPVHWDVRSHRGKRATITAVDRASDGWGHILLDDIQFSNDAAGNNVLDREIAGAMLAFCGADANHNIHESRRAEGKGFIYFVDVKNGSEPEFMNALAAPCGIVYQPSSGMRVDEPNFGTLAIGCKEGRAAIFTDATLDHAAICNRLAEPTATTGGYPVGARLGAAGVIIDIPPHTTKTATIAVAWHSPNRTIGGRHVGNYYCKQFREAGDAARAALKGGAADALTLQFRDSLYKSTIPWPLLDAAGSQASILRSPTVMRFADGNVAGWEGLDANEGCCPMNCCHVYNYVQTTAYLYPELERNVRKLDLKHQQDHNGGVHNRIAVPIVENPTGEFPFADGHLGTILKSYREHLHSPDDSFLNEFWPNIKNAIEFAIGELDRDEDGVLEAEQWNTYDQIVTGVNTFVGTLYLAALRAGEEMAKIKKEPDVAARYRKIYNTGAARYAEVGWNGEYFEQRGGHEFGAGCLADQLLGEWWARILNLGTLLPREKVKKALASIYKYNFLPDFSKFAHRQRVFADGADRGLLNCTWPRGGRPGTAGYPGKPILYCDEVWTGVEYAVASLMLYEGMIEEAVTITRAARDRYDGTKRNPWNEIECGDQYARAMSSWSLLIAAQGFFCDGPANSYEFDPIFSVENHKSFFSGPSGWGVFQQNFDEKKFVASLEVRFGEVRIQNWTLRSARPLAPDLSKLKINERPLMQYKVAPAGEKGVMIQLNDPIVIKSGETLTVDLSH